MRFVMIEYVFLLSCADRFERSRDFLTTTRQLARHIHRKSSDGIFREGFGASHAVQTGHYCLFKIAPRGGKLHSGANLYEFEL